MRFICQVLPYLRRRFNNKNVLNRASKISKLGSTFGARSTRENSFGWTSFEPITTVQLFPRYNIRVKILFLPFRRLTFSLLMIFKLKTENKENRKDLRRRWNYFNQSGNKREVKGGKSGI